MASEVFIFQFKRTHTGISRTEPQSRVPLKFKVTPDVLIPRPETELLVEEAIKIVGAAPCGRPQSGQPHGVAPTINILDIGTGTGCIAVALAKHLPDARVTATDFSKEAFAVAEENIARHQLEDRVKLILRFPN